MTLRNGRRCAFAIFPNTSLERQRIGERLASSSMLELLVGSPWGGYVWGSDHAAAFSLAISASHRRADNQRTAKAIDGLVSIAGVDERRRRHIDRRRLRRLMHDAN